ncbi:MAG: ATP synthase F1 subunit epsilon [Mycoplasma sp.]|nr:ATP synthase F1 subunit epsilon [Mycoplasma sp.]
MSSIALKILTPNGVFFEKDVEMVTLKTPEGYIGLQKNRLPFISSIDISSLFIKIDASNRKIAAIGGGIVFVEKTYIDIFTDDIQWKEELNKFEIQSLIDEANRKINESKNNNVERNKNEIILKKALNKLETLSK